MASGISDYLENAWLNSLRNTAFSVVTLYVALHDGYPGETGASEVVGGSYARQSAAFNAAAAGLIDNTSNINFASMPGVTVFGVSLWDAATAGNCLYTGMLGGTQNFFTAANTGDLFTSYGHGLVNDDRVIIEAGFGAGLPAGPTEGTIYHVISATTDTFQISATQGGGAVALTSDGEGIVTFVDEKVVGAGSTFQIAAGDLDVRLN